MPISEPTPAPSQIPQTDPGAFYREHRSETLAAMARVLDSGWYVLGEEVRTFEQEFAGHVGLAHAIGVSSGTDAIALALCALGIVRGDRVATVSHTAVATAAAIQLIGARPVFVDISPGTFLLEAGHLAEALAQMPPVKALVVVHLYGQAADIPAIATVAARYGARVVEDCAQAHGASWHGRPVGSMGAAGCFSFYPTKNLGALGDAGMVVTSDPKLAAQLRMLREYGWRQRYVSETKGFNSRLDEVQAAVLRLRLPFLADSNQRRAAIASAYDQGLAHTGLRLPAVRPGASHVYHQYVIRHGQRERLRARLAEQGILTNVHYPVPIHLQPAYRRCCDTAPGGLPATEAAAREVLSLPMYPELEDGAVERVIDTIVSLL
jgi:dTDP-4-amino-4,6-dideoxygalactose transaminase